MRCSKSLGLLLGLLLAPAAMADPGGNGFGSFGLTEGEPDFIGCLNGSSCADRFFKFLNQASMEQGFTMQGGSPMASSVINHHTGWSAGGMLHSFPLGPPRENLSGKTENTQFSPVLPKLGAARTWDSGDVHYGLGMMGLPPVPVQGAAALILGAQGSMARATKSGRHGLELDFSFVRAKAPISASKEQVEDASEFADGHLEEETYAENCDPETGCIDTFSLANLEIVYRRSWTLGEHWVPNLGLGLTVLNEWLYIQYDDTAWSAHALQPAVHLGTAWTPNEVLFLSAGGSSALRQSNQSLDGIGVFYRLEGTAAYRF
jgi:hypothetical protein